MEPAEYHRYIFNQYVMYSALETRANQLGLLDGIEGIQRAELIRDDLQELEVEHGIVRDPDLLCPVVGEYVPYVMRLENAEDILAHLYVRHFGDMYGGQMIAKRNPGMGMMYVFQDVDNLKAKVRAMLNDDMADEANRCFEFAMQLFEELGDE